MAARDPNHPLNLDIKPSAKSKVHGNGTSELSQDQAWETDSATDIQRWGIAGRIWEAAYLFRKYLTVPTPDVEFDPPCPIFDVDVTSDSRTILELGSGAGYVGLACAQQLHRQRAGCDSREHSDTVILTDLENVTDLMTRNARAAGFSEGGITATQGRQRGVDVLVRPLPWGSKQHAQSILAEIGSSSSRDCSLDFVLCSDLVYFPELLAPLLRSLIHLTQPSPDTNATPTILIAYKIRSLSKEQPFWNNLGVWFDVEIVACRYRNKQNKWGSSHRFGSFTADLDESQRDTETDAEDDYFVFIARRKKTTHHFEAPGDDEKLMSGYMFCNDPASGDTPSETRLVRGEGGAGYLEWALMGSLAI